MLPTIEKSKTGKPLILHKKYKFRESHTLRNGNIVWGCLGRDCKASLKTDSQMTQITSVGGTHEGKHPVTMSTLTRTPQQPRRSLTSARTPTAVGDSPSAARSVVADDDDPAATTITAAHAVMTSTPSTSTPMSPCTRQDLSHGLMDASASSPVSEGPGAVAAAGSGDDLLAENTSLKKEIADLKQQINDILNHTIESDRRLLEFTNDIFAVNAHTSGELASIDRHARTEPCLTTGTAVATMADGGEGTFMCELTTAKQKIKLLESDVMTLRKPCDRCIILQEETSNMIATIRTLEEEIRTVREAAVNTVALTKPSPPCVPLHNRFSTLENNGTEQQTRNFTLVQKQKRKQRKKYAGGTLQAKPRDRMGETKSKSLEIPFKNVIISGDSHVRGIAGLVKRHHPSARVSGMCKPGAGLLSIAPPSTSVSLAADDHCHVLVAGANDVAAGREDIIYNHMENTIAQLRAASKVVVSTLPHRYDLAADSPVNQTIALLNNYIAELCSRYEGVELLDFGGIRRSAFTRHGMHLSFRGKRELARLISERMATAHSAAVTRQQRSRMRRPSAAESIPATTTAAKAPRPSGVLQRDTYAGVVKNSITADVQSEAELQAQKNVFLGQRPLVAGLT